MTSDLKTVRYALEGVRNCYKTHSKISSSLWDCDIKPAIAILDRMIKTPATEVEALRKENEELKAKLDKAKDGLKT